MTNDTPRMAGLYRKFALANCQDMYRAAHKLVLTIFGILIVEMLFVIGAIICSWVFSGPGLAIALLSAIALAIVILKVIIMRWLPRSSGRGGIALMATPVIVFVSLSRAPSTEYVVPGIDLSLSNVFMLIATCYSATVAILIITGLTFRRNGRLSPDSPGVTASGELVSVVAALSHADPFLYFPDRNEMIHALDRAAESIGLHLPRVIHLEEVTQAQTFANRCANAARHIRGLGLWVALPKPDTAQRLSEELVSFIDVLVRGTYDGLPTGDTPPPSNARSSRDLLVRGQSLIAGLLPMAAILAARELGFGLDGVAGDALVSFGVLWAIATLLAAVDPRMSERLGAIREFLAVVRSGGGTKGP